MWGPVVLFPHGTYRISRTLVLTNNFHILGQGSAIIMQTNFSADIFFSAELWRWAVTGIVFQGGRNHLHFGNPNTAAGFWTIDSCVFSNASSAAIRTMVDPPTCGGSGKIARGCVQPESTTAFVTRSKFFENEQCGV